MARTTIDHTNCSHPRTAAGRRACRAAVAKGTTLNMTPGRSAELDRQVTVFSNAFNDHYPHPKPTPTACPIDDIHCEQCGNLNPGHDEGYTACCNELVVYRTVDCRNHHG